MLIENGDTAVIGGVYKHDVASSMTGIPLLMRIPLIGYLFSTRNSTDDQNELFVFLTARIMNADETFKRSL